MPSSDQVYSCLLASRRLLRFQASHKGNASQGEKRGCKYLRSFFYTKGKLSQSPLSADLAFRAHRAGLCVYQDKYDAVRQWFTRMGESTNEDSLVSEEKSPGSRDHSVLGSNPSPGYLGHLVAWCLLWVPLHKMDTPLSGISSLYHCTASHTQEVRTQ